LLPDQYVTVWETPKGDSDIMNRVLFNIDNKMLDPQHLAKEKK